MKTEKPAAYASLAFRGIGLVLDFVLFCLVFFPVTYLVKGKWLMTPQDHLWIIFDPICAVFLAIILLYFILLEGLFGWTVGKLVLGMRVRTVNLQRITLRQSLVRNLARMIDGLPAFNIIGMITIARSPIRQRVGDQLAGTVVTRNTSDHQ